jgi:SprT protein
MPKKEAPLMQLGDYLPVGSFEEVVQYLNKHKVQLTITRKRESILGDYRHASNNQVHRISVNGNLNKYAFLITLLHELAHLFTFEKYGNKVQAHGQEWKNEFSKILAQFILLQIFPEAIKKALLKTLQNPAASSCADETLLRTLYEYDEKKSNTLLVEQLQTGQLFIIKGKRIFAKGEQVKKRIKCTEISTGKVYLFSPVYEVILYNN